MAHPHVIVLVNDSETWPGLDATVLYVCNCEVNSHTPSSDVAVLLSNTAQYLSSDRTWA